MNPAPNNHPKQPDFVIALEFKDLCGRRSLSDTISKKLNNSIVAADLEKILEKEQNNILLVLDGYDEQLKHCEDKTMMADVIEIIQGEHDRNFNLIVQRFSKCFKETIARLLFFSEIQLVFHITHTAQCACT